MVVADGVVAFPVGSAVPLLLDLPVVVIGVGVGVVIAVMLEGISWVVALSVILLSELGIDVAMLVLAPTPVPVD